MQDDELRAALSAPPALDAAFAARVRKVARAELADLSPRPAWLLEPRAALAGALVPMLLLACALAQTTRTVKVASTIFANPDHSAE